jgi:hypothetical protein
MRIGSEHDLTTPKSVRILDPASRGAGPKGAPANVHFRGGER